MIRQKEVCKKCVRYFKSSDMCAIIFKEVAAKHTVENLADEYFKSMTIVPNECPYMLEQIMANKL